MSDIENFSQEFSEGNTPRQDEFATPPINQKQMIDWYMEQVLEHEKTPKSVYKFAKDHGFTETEFYKYFGSIEDLKSKIWISFFDMTIGLSSQDLEYGKYSNQEKMLTFFYTFFELLTLNRSYVLYALQEDQQMLNSMPQLAGLRKKVKSFAADLIQEANDGKSLKVLKQPVGVFSEGAWWQFLFILKFWKEDNSPSFEKTDLMIEKSVRAVFDLFETTPLESVFDFGKFLWKEKLK